MTDRCNFRCTYCMPLDQYEWISKKEILTFEEITRLATLFVGLGVEKIRLTGGEPLVRQNLDQLVAKVAAISGLKDLCLTTNGATDLTNVGLGTDACPVKFQSSPRQVAGGPQAE